jgi:hypothetical protein
MDPRKKNGIKQLISRNTGKVIFPERAPTRPIMTVELTAIVLKIVKVSHPCHEYQYMVKFLFNTKQHMKI